MAVHTVKVLCNQVSLSQSGRKVEYVTYIFVSPGRKFIGNRK